MAVLLHANAREPEFRSPSFVRLLGEAAVVYATDCQFTALDVESAEWVNLHVCAHPFSPPRTIQLCVSQVWKAAVFICCHPFKEEQYTHIFSISKALAGGGSHRTMHVYVRSVLNDKLWPFLTDFGLCTQTRLVQQMTPFFHGCVCLFENNLFWHLIVDRHACRLPDLSFAFIFSLRHRGQTRHGQHERAARNEDLLRVDSILLNIGRNSKQTCS